MSVYTTDARLAFRRICEFYIVNATPVYLATGLIGYLFLIYATDTLLLAPAAVGTLLAISRVYDGVSDLVLGTWSDRTTGRYGRRRPFIIAGGLMLLSFVGIWLPPENLGAMGMLLFVGAMLLVFDTANTLIGVPFTALGVELGQTPERRTFFNVVGKVVGLPATFGAIFLMQYLVDAEDARATGRPWFIAIGIIFAVTVTISALRIKELPVHHAAPERNVFRMLREVLGNRYHSRLLGVQLVESFSFTSIAFMVPYVMTYIVERPELIFVILIAYTVVETLSRIGWLMLIPRWGMQRIWMIGLGLWALTFLFFPLVFALGFPAYLAMAALGGIASGAASVNFAMLGDIADYDARHSGRQRQGVYMTIYRLVAKIGGALVAFLLGWLLQFSGFVPNAEQGVEAIMAIAASTSLLPLVALLIGIHWLRGYDFYQREGISDGKRAFIEKGTLADVNRLSATA